jgi:hypothetical protein
VRESFASQLVELEHHLEDGLERAAVTLPQIADAIQVPTPDKVQKIADEAGRLRRAGRTVDSELVIVTARQAPVASDLRLVLSLIEVAHHSILIANQFHLITEQLINVDPAAIDRGGTAAQLAAMTHLAGSQLCHAVRAFRSRDLAVPCGSMSRMTRSTSSTAKCSKQHSRSKTRPRNTSWRCGTCSSYEASSGSQITPSTSLNRPRSSSPPNSASSPTHRCRDTERSNDN